MYYLQNYTFPSTPQRKGVGMMRLSFAKDAERDRVKTDVLTRPHERYCVILRIVIYRPLFMQNTSFYVGIT